VATTDWYRQVSSRWGQVRGRGAGFDFLLGGLKVKGDHTGIVPEEFESSRARYPNVKSSRSVRIPWCPERGMRLPTTWQSDHANLLKVR
jgi:hypothetical protein